MEPAGGFALEEFLERRSMTPDLVAELMRQLMKEALILSAPVLLITVALSFVLSLVQTLTSLQEQSLTNVPRLFIVVMVLLVGMPWFLGRMAHYTESLFVDLRRFLG
jgi:flagellar biosynthetic protein FliQ